MDYAARLSKVSATDATILNLARAEAYDRYVQALLVRPKVGRPAAVIVAAFHGELSRIPLLVREPMMGEIRLQWWDDVLTAFGPSQSSQQSAPPSPLAAQVCNVIAANPSARTHFLNAIAARRAELDADAFSDSHAFAHYLEHAGASPLHVISDVLGVDKTPDYVRAISEAGKAIAVVELALRLQRFADLGRRVVIPDPGETSLGSAGSNQEDVSTPIARLERWAQRALASFKVAQTQLCPRLIYAVLPVALVQPYLRALQARKESTYPDGNPLTPVGRLSRLWWAARTGRVVSR